MKTCESLNEYKFRENIKKKISILLKKAGTDNSKKTGKKYSKRKIIKKLDKIETSDLYLFEFALSGKNSEIEEEKRKIEEENPKPLKKREISYVSLFSW